MKTYVVADLHGRYDLLEKALKLIDRDAHGQALRFICLGDFVDRGPESRQIIERFMAGPDNPDHEWIILQGNHEDMMLLALSDPRYLRIWRQNGGTQTLKSYGASSGNNPHYTTAKVPSSHCQYLQSLPVSFEDDHRIYVHAGVPFDRPLDQVHRSTLQWMMYREPDLDEYPDAEYYNGLGQHVSGKHIVHGHVQDHKHPKVDIGRTNLDAWAYHTGRLAIGVFEGPGGPEKILSVYGKCEPDYQKYLTEYDLILRGIDLSC